MMHNRNGVGFDKVYAEAVMMIPKFEKALFLYLKNDRSENIDDLENLLKNEGIISQLSLHFFLRPTPGQLHACNALLAILWQKFRMYGGVWRGDDS